MVRTLVIADDAGEGELLREADDIGTVTVEQGTYSVVVVTKVEPWAFVTVYTLVVVV